MKEYKSKILIDEPVDSDAFSGGGHQRSAMALANLIDQLSDQDAAIGLEGGWGAGKSSVIKISKDCLKGINDDFQYHIFTFDLWEHQTEDFRRSFLEEFVEWVGQEGLINKAQLDDCKKQVRDKERTVSTTNNKEYSITGALFILSLPLLPIIYANLQPEKLENSISLIDFSLVGIAWFVLIGGYIAFGIKLLWHMLTLKGVRDVNEHAKLKENQLARLKFSLSQALRIFSREVDKEDTHQSFRETDPTTIEFHQIFREILQLVHDNSAAKDRKIIFVLDNIDRLPQAQVAAIWSEVRSLFSNSTYRNEFPDAIVTAVIPYDRDYILKSFPDRFTKEQNANGANADVIQKTLSANIKVAPPILKDWQEYLRIQLDEALHPKLESTSHFTIFSLLKQYFSQTYDYITPRAIISFINEIVPLHLQWGKTFDIETIVLYVIHREVIERDPTSLLRTETVSPQYLQLTGNNDWQKSFAALYYNVELDRAYEVTLSQPIEEALILDLKDDIVELSKHPGFDAIFVDSLNSVLNNLSNLDINQYSQIAANVDELKLSEGLRSIAWRSIKECLEKIELNNITDLNNIEGLLSVLRNHKGSEAYLIATKIRSRLQQGALNSQDSKQLIGRIWTQHIVRVAESVGKERGDKFKKKFLKNTKIPLGKEFCLGVAFTCSKLAGAKFDDFKLEHSAKKILSSIQDSDLHTIEFLKALNLAINQIDGLFEKDTRSALLDRVVATLDNGSVSEKPLIHQLLKLYFGLYAPVEHENEFHEKLVSHMQSGTLLYRGTQLENEEGNLGVEGVSYVLWLAIASQRGVDTIAVKDNHPAFGNITHLPQWYRNQIHNLPVNDDLASAVSDLIGKADAFSSWLGYAIEDKTPSGFFKAVFIHLVEKQKFNRLRVDDTLFNYGELRAIVGEKLALSFLKKFSSWHTYFEDAVSEVEDIHQIPAELLEDVNRLEKGIRERYMKIVKIVDQHLKKVSKEEWEVAFEESNSNLKQLIARRHTGNLYLPVEHFRPALLTHAIKVFRGETAPTIYDGNWEEVLNALKSFTQRKLAKDLLIELENIRVTLAGCERFIVLYSNLAEALPFESKPNIALDQFFSQIIISNNVKVTQFVENNLEVIKKCIQKADIDTVASFNEILEGLEDSDNIKINKRGHRLRVSLGLEDLQTQAQAQAQAQANSDSLESDPKSAEVES